MSTMERCSATSWNSVRAVAVESRKSSSRNVVAAPRPCSDRHRAEAAVDHELRAGEERLLAASRSDRPFEVAGVTEAAHRRVAQDRLGPLWE